MTQVIPAIAANFLYAVADNLNGIVAKRNKPLQITLWATVCGIIIFAVPAVLFYRNEFSNLTASNLVVMLAINLLVNLGYISFIAGMNSGAVTITGVIGGAFPAVTTLSSLLLFHEYISSLQGFAIILILVGITLSSIYGTVAEVIKDLKNKGLIFGLGAFFFWGIYFALIRIPIEQIGWFLPQYSSNFIGFVMFTIIALLSRRRDTFEKPKLLWVLALLSAMQISGSILFNYAISKGATSIVAPIVGSSPVVFVIIAYFVFHEKLNKKQWFGIVLALIGITSLSILSA